MKTFIRDYDLPELSAPFFTNYFDGMIPCVYDIETTGFMPSNSKIILTAMLVPTDRGVRVTQYLAEDPFEEDLVISATLRFLEEQKAGYLVTYNGDRFDVPFTDQRAESLGLPPLGLFSFDLYRFLRRHSTLPDELDSMSQKSVEAHYGIASFRKDTITGRESIVLYNEYALNGSGTAEKIILTHNREDVLQLYRLLLLCSYGDFGNILRSGDIHKALGAHGFPVCGGRLTARAKITGATLCITGKQNTSPVSLAVFAETDHAVSAEFKRATSGYDVTLPLFKNGDSLYTDLERLSLGTLAEPLKSLNGYVGGYLILREDGVTDHEAVNALSRAIVSSLVPTD